MPRTQGPRVAESVAADLRSRILRGEYAGADEDRLPTQDQLVRDFGVSYPSIREALRILETEGLVTVRRGNVGGADVHRPGEAFAAYHLGLAMQGSRVPLADLAEGLQQLEPMCAGLCAQRSDRAREVVPLLRRSIERAEEVVADGPAYTRVSREFHDLIVALTPNVTLQLVVRSLVALWSAQELSWAEAMAQQGDYPSARQARESLRTHRRLTDEIERGNRAEAERIARSHLSATQSLLLRRFEGGIVNAASESARRALQLGPTPKGAHL